MMGLLDTADLQKLLDEAISQRNGLCRDVDYIQNKLVETRQIARFYRDLYVGIVGKTYEEAYRLPWEDEK